MTEKTPISLATHRYWKVSINIPKTDKAKVYLTYDQLQSINRKIESTGIDKSALKQYYKYSGQSL